MCAQGSSNNKTRNRVFAVIAIVAIVAIILALVSCSGSCSSSISTKTETTSDQTQTQTTTELTTSTTTTDQAATPETSSDDDAVEKQEAAPTGTVVPTVTAPTAIANLTYNGTAQTLVNAGSTSGGTLQYALGVASQATGSYSTTLPSATRGGTYYVWYKVVGDDTYASTAADKVSVTIKKALANVTAPVAKTGLVYNTTAQTLVDPATTTGGTIQYALGDSMQATSAYSTSLPTGTDAGTYYVWCKVVGNDDYYGVDPGLTIVTIDKATPSNPETPAVTVNGTTITVTAPSSTNHGPVKYGINTSNDASAATWQDSNEFTGLTDGYDYYLFIRYDEDTNYKASAVATSQKTNICFAAGTKITMADGSLKNIENITEGESVLTFNHETGVYEGQKVYLAYHGSYKAAAFTLHFDNGQTLSIAGMHDLFNQEALQYVAVTRSNATNFVGEHFYSVDDGRYVELTSVTFETEAVDFYSLYTDYNANCIANGMISIPIDIEETMNIYKFNEDLTIDQAQLAADIAQFGLYEYTPNPVYSQELFDAQRWKYLNIVVGKGFLTQEECDERINAYLNGDY